MHHAEILALRRANGQPIGAMDALIAAICCSVDAELATRDVEGFAGLWLRLVNPWDAAAGPLG